jgi:tripartite ATP-independent transporter DctM subunit
MIAGLAGFGALFALLFLGVPLGFGMALIGVGGFAALTAFGPATAMVGSVVVDTVVSYNFAVLAQFILMGAFLTHSKLGEDLYRASYAFLGHRRGGLALATILACGGFSAVCGSSTATAATMARVAVEPMRRYGYDIGFACGTVAAGGTLGILIPPSTIMVIYGLMTDNDIGKLFVAGILPGMVGIALYMLAVSIVTHVKPAFGPPGAPMSWPDRFRALREVWGLIVLFGVVIGGIYGGAFTPNEAAGVGAGGAFLFALIRRTLTARSLVDLLGETARTTANMMTVIIGALLFSNFITVAGVPRGLSEWVGGLQVAPIAVLLTIVGIYLILGCLLDSISMVLLTVPIFYPIAHGLGFDPIWFGVILVVVVEIGLITPPIGINVFMIKATFPDVPMYTVFRGVAPFIAVDIVRLAILIFIPGISLVLPSLMR